MKDFPNGQYYLHTNGKMIVKPQGGVDETSDFVVKMWPLPLVGNSPEAYFLFLKEAKALGAKQSEIERLITHTGLFAFVSADRIEELRP